MDEKQELVSIKKMWAVVLNLPDEVMQIIFCKIRIPILKSIRGKSKKFRRLTRIPLREWVQTVKWNWNRGTEIAFEPLCKDVGTSYLFKDFTHCTAIIRTSKEVTNFLREMKPSRANEMRPFMAESLLLDFQPAHTLTNGEQSNLKSQLTYIKAKLVLDKFGVFISSFSVNVDFSDKITLVQFKMLFSNMVNLKCLFIGKAHFSPLGTTVDNEITYPCLPRFKNLRNLKLVYCNQVVSAAFISACCENLQYLYFLHTTMSRVQFESFFGTLLQKKLLKTLKYFSVHIKDWITSQIISHSLINQATNLKGLRISASAENLSDKNCILNLPFLSNNIDNFQYILYRPALNYCWDELLNFPENTTLRTLYLSYWFLKLSNLKLYIKKFKNLRRLEFVYEHPTRLESSLSVPLDWLLLAKRLSKRVSVPVIIFRHGISGYIIRTGGIKFFGVSQPCV